MAYANVHTQFRRWGHAPTLPPSSWREYGKGSTCNYLSRPTLGRVAPCVGRLSLEVGGIATMKLPWTKTENYARQFVHRCPRLAALDKAGSRPDGGSCPHERNRGTGKRGGASRPVVRGLPSLRRPHVRSGAVTPDFGDDRARPGEARRPGFLPGYQRRAYPLASADALNRRWAYAERPGPTTLPWLALGS